MTIMNTRQDAAPQVSFINDPVIRGIIYQVVAAVVLVVFFVWIINNTATNLAAQNKSTGFEFLWAPSGFDISFKVLEYSRSSSYFQTLLVGITNTLLVAFLGIIFATILGFTIGVARLSSNFIISSLATVYVETIRNIPLLLQLFFWYFAVLASMPAVRNSYELPLGSFINKRGIYIPRPTPDEQFAFVWIAIAIAIVAILALRFWAMRRLEATGKRFPVFFSSLGLLLVIVGGIWFFSGADLAFEVPTLQGLNFRGGVQLPPELVALLFGLSIYTASFIAEIVRAGIQAVSRGQTEAADSLGLRENDRLRLVIVPQAMRVIIPPLTSQYLNLTKNSSLGAAIGYPELFNVFGSTALNQSSRAIECISITMLVYLTFSLITSAIMNWYNARVSLVER
nr:amino acid ABC transporter permease [Devosia oryziradicis]